MAAEQNTTTRTYLDFEGLKYVWGKIKKLIKDTSYTKAESDKLTAELSEDDINKVCPEI